MYPLGQKVCLVFSIRCYGKTQMNCLAHPILLEPAMQRWSLLPLCLNLGRLFMISLWKMVEMMRCDLRCIIESNTVST